MATRRRYSVAGGALPNGYDAGGQHVSGQQIIDDATQANGGQVGNWFVDDSGQLVNDAGQAVKHSGHLAGSHDLSFGKQLLHAAPYIGAAVGMGIPGALAGAGGGAAASAGSALTESAPTWGLASGAGLPGAVGIPGALASSTVGTGMAGLAPALSGGGASAGGGSVGIGSTLKNFLMGGEGHRGLDPTSLILGGLGLFGGDGTPEGYSGSSTNPEATLGSALGETHRLLDQLQKRGPVKLRMPDPISIAGVPFQIGGGFGQDERGFLPSLHPEMQGNPLATMNLQMPPRRKKESGV